MIVNCVVVTYNRKELLLECITALKNQTHKIDKIYIIDNHSTDGTYDYIKENVNFDNVQYIYLDKNYGGAGGFYYGMKYAYKNSNFDWIWIMDDDTIPHNDSLEKLLEKKEILKNETISFLASSVFGPNNEVMNLPSISNEIDENGYKRWYRYLDYKMVEIENATFVSLLFNRKAIEKCGLPYKDFFIWGDDTEYTRRVTKYYGKAYFCGDSIVTHKRYNAKPLSIFYEENKNRIKMYKFYYRNNLIYRKYYSNRKNLISFKIVTICDAFKVLVKCKNKFLKFNTILRGYFGYLFGSYGKKHFNNRFKSLNETDEIKFVVKNNEQ